VGTAGRDDRVLPRRLEGRGGRWVRSAWIAVAAATALLGTGGTVRAVRDPTLVALRPITSLVGSSASGSVATTLVLIAPAVVSVALCTIVWRRRRDDPMALLFSLTLLVTFTAGSRMLLAWQPVPILRLAHPVAVALGCVGLAAVAATFPDGRAVPRPARWLPVAMATVFLAVPDTAWMLEELLQDQAAPWRGRAALVALFCLLALGGACQFHRYRHDAGPVGRQQVRWVLAPLALLLVLAGAGAAVTLLGAGSAQRWLGWVVLATLAAGAVVPLAVGNAVLRHRLWDLDRVVSRTVTYTLVVAVLGALYAATVTLLGSLVSGLRGEPGEDVAVAASVLLVAALFHPLRARVRSAVDRRFDRTGTERRQVLEDLTNDLRHRTDLDAIRLHVEHTTDHLVRPTHVDLWLVRRTPDG
jgi:hypothetical protein